MAAITVTSGDPRHDDARVLTAEGLQTLVGRSVGRGAQLVAQVLIARVFGPAIFGTYAIGWTILNVLGLVTPLGLGSAVIRYAPAWRREGAERFRAMVWRVLRLALVTGVAAAAAVVALAGWLGRAVFNKPDVGMVLRAMAPGIAVFAVFRVLTAVTRVSQRMKFSVAAEDVLQPVALLVFVVVAWRAQLGLVGIAAGAGLSFVVGCAAALGFTARLYPELRGRLGPLPPGALREDVLPFAIQASLAEMFSILIAWADRLAVGVYMPSASVGFYHAASQVSVLFALILSSFAAIFAPMIADLAHRGEWVRVRSLFRVGTRWGLYACVPLFLVIVISPAAVMTGLFGRPYAAASTALLLLGIAQLVNAATGAVGMLLIMSGNQREWFVLSLSMLGLNVAACVTLIPRFGLTGAAVSGGVAIAGLFLAGVALAWRRLGFGPWDRHALRLALPAGAALLAGLGAHAVLGGGRFIDLVVVGGVTAAAFALALALFGLPAEDRALFAGLWRGAQRLGTSEGPA